MPGIDSNADWLKPVSPDTLKALDAARMPVEEEVLRRCLAEDTPEITMGSETEAKIKTGLGFVSKMFRAIVTFGADKIIDDELQWARRRLPVSGVSMKMVLRNFERYTQALEKKLPSTAY